MCTGNWIKLYAPVAALILFVATVPCGVYADDTSVFKITDTEGYVGLRYRYDGELTQQASSPETKVTRSIFEEEIHMQTYGYVYHPNLLKVNLGAGILFSQEKLNTVSSDTEQDGTFYDLNANLMFLEKKPYPLRLFYNQSHPSVAVNVTDVFVQKNEKYGMNFSLLKPVSPVTLKFETYKQSNSGDSFTQVVDERNTYQNVSANASMKNGGNARLSYTKNKQESLSGSKNLPIQPFNVTTKTTDLNSRFVFGYQRNINFNLMASHTSQEQDRDLEELRLSPNLTWNHSKDFNSYYRYTLQEREQSGFESRGSSGATGLRYQWNKNLFSNAELHYGDNKATGLELNNIGARGFITYKHQLAIGLLQFNMGLNYDDYDRVASNMAKVVDANYTLTGSNPVTLGHDYINKATIVVKRADTNEVLTEGVANDYVVVVIAKQTQIQKVNPALPVTLDVLVSYEYDPGGSAAYTLTGQSYQTSLQVNDNFTTFINYRDSKHSLKSGSPTFPLVASDTTSYGFRVNYPFKTDIDLTVGGEALNEKHNENLSSYNKNSMDAFMQVTLPLSSDLRLTMRRVRVDNLYSSEDVKLSSYGLRLKSHPAERFILLLQLSDDTNTGGSVSRHSRNMNVTGQWRVRKLLLEFGARRIMETYGVIKHDRTIFNAKLRREF